MMIRLVVTSRAIRWLLAPAFVLLIVIVGMAVGSEDRSQFGQAGQNPSPAEDRSTGPRTSGEGSGSPSNSSRGDDLSGLQVDDAGPIETTSNLEIRGRAGSVDVQLNPDGPELAFPRGADGTGGLATELTTDGMPPDTGFRLAPDGRLELVPADEVAPGDIVLQPHPDGLSLPLGDGDRLDVRVVGDDEVLRFDRVSSDGLSQPVVPDADNVIELGDGVSIRLPTPPDQAAPSPPRGINWRLFLIWLTVMLVGSLGLAYHLHRNGDPILFTDRFTAPDELPVDRLVDFLAALRADPDPARAIRLAFQGAEQGLGTLPAREATETPFEWHRRVADRQPHLDRELGSLCSLFTTARFAPERPHPADRDVAVDNLARLADLAGYHEPDDRATAIPVAVP